LPAPEIRRPLGREPAALLAAAVLATAVSAWRPADPLTWVLEAFPVLLAAPLLLATRWRFPLTPLVQRLLLLHACILLLGAHYTYARVPLGFWAQDAFGFTRNHYDRVGHLAQGFIPALVAREVLVRASPVRGGRWLFFLVCCICLAASAFYEFIEWWAALVGGESAEAFLGTQGDPWDTQADMGLALVGAASAQILLGRAHDRQLSAYTGATGGSP
jgi:putative membrane protein